MEPTAARTMASLVLHAHIQTGHNLRNTINPQSRLHSKGKHLRFSTSRTFRDSDITDSVIFIFRSKKRFFRNPREGEKRRTRENERRKREEKGKKEKKKERIETKEKKRIKEE